MFTTVSSSLLDEKKFLPKHPSTHWHLLEFFCQFSFFLSIPWTRQRIHARHPSWRHTGQSLRVSYPYPLLRVDQALLDATQPGSTVPLAHPWQIFRPHKSKSKHAAATLSTPFGRQSKLHSFSTGVHFEHILFPLLKSVFLQQHPLQNLLDTHPLIAHHNVLITHLSSLDFSHLRGPDPSTD